MEPNQFGYMRSLFGFAILVAVLVLLSACDPGFSYVMHTRGYSFTVIPPNKFALDIMDDRYRELGGENAPNLLKFIDSEVKSARACSNGYVLQKPMAVQGGYWYIRGTCAPNMQE